MESLPVEILSNILGDLCIKDVDNVSRSGRLAVGNVRMAARDRMDVRVYLHKLVNDSVGFLRVLLRADSALCGRCVSPFLYPWVGEHAGPWDLYCYGDVLQASLLIDFLRRMDFSVSSFTTSRHYGASRASMCMRSSRASVMIHMEHGRTPFGTMADATFSVDKCAITGYAVMSMEHALSLQEKYYMRPDMDPQQNPVPRGLDVTESSKSLLVDDEGRLQALLGEPLRTLLDEDSYISIHGRNIYGNTVERAASIEMYECVSGVCWDVVPNVHGSPGLFIHMSPSYADSLCLKNNMSTPSLRSLSSLVLEDCVSAGIVTRDLVTWHAPSEDPTGIIPFNTSTKRVPSFVSCADAYCSNLMGYLAGKFMCSYMTKFASTASGISPMELCELGAAPEH